MSRKRKKPSRRPDKAGGSGRAVERSGFPSGPGPDVFGGQLPVGWVDFDDPEADSPSAPATINFEDSIGRITMPGALAEFLMENDLGEALVAHVEDLQRRGAHADMFATFIDGREVPERVSVGVEDYHAFMESRYGGA